MINIDLNSLRPHYEALVKTLEKGRRAIGVPDNGTSFSDALNTSLMGLGARGGNTRLLRPGDARLLDHLPTGNGPSNLGLTAGAAGVLTSTIPGIPTPPKAPAEPWWMSTARQIAPPAAQPATAPAPEPTPPTPLPPSRPQGFYGGSPETNPLLKPLGAPPVPGDPNLPNMVDPTQLSQPGMRARTVIDPNTGRAMNDFYTADSGDLVRRFFKSAFGS